MRNEKPILSIAIPTYNRAKELQECLDSVIPQVLELKESVEIFISDNASVDETPEVLKDYSEKYDFIHYSRNSKNIGFDLNLIRAIKGSKGRYVWLFADDDWLAKGALNEILGVIKENKPCYISTNFYYSKDRVNVFIHSKQKKFLVKKDVKKASLSDVLLYRNHWFSFISSNILKKDFLDIIGYENNSKMRFKSWVQIYIISQVLSSKSCGYISSYYAVISRTGNGRENLYTFVELMPKGFHYIFKEFKVEKAIQKKVMNNIRRTFLPLKAFLLFKLEKSDIRKVDPSLIPFYYKLFYYTIPSNFITFAWKLKRKISGKSFTLPNDFKKD